MAVLRAAIVDDEAPARDRLRSLLEAYPDIDIVIEAADGRDAVEKIRALRPPLLFLDVQMPELDGFGVLQDLGRGDRPQAIVFVTAYDSYAMRAFEVNAIDYLLKPYTAKRFEDALERARARLKVDASQDQPIEALLRAMAARNPAAERLAIKTQEGVQFVRIPEIDWLQADGNYTIVHIGNAAMRTRETVSDLEQRLEPFGFTRIHRSVIVNVDRIFRLESWTHGEYLVVLRNGTKLNSGRGYSDRVRMLIEQR